MSDDDDRPKSFEETLRNIAAEVTKSAERISQSDLSDLERVARENGIDPARARVMADLAGGWLKKQLDGNQGFPTARPGSPASSAPTPKAPDTPADIAETPLAPGVPSPVDIPTAAQGRALAALDSGRWTVEPGTVTLATQTGKGPQPDNAQALGLALHVRDWVDQDGDLTAAGVHALDRWLDLSSTDE
ncbi:hypothetical protein [Patulibacter americanus]|uniref:hypothetical protein n=1 Tax=Patulibacter americanus TaxID=588672 RepID=UPI0003B6ED63|nr:hypothetical protein [Patulibacter americanus]